MSFIDELARLAPGTSARMEPGEVVAVAPGGASDGNARVTVRWRGAKVVCPYPSSYAPAVGHAVLLLVQPPQVVIVARLVGTP